MASYTRADLGLSELTSYCPTNSHRDPTLAGQPVVGANGLLELDPSNTDCGRAQRNRTFVPCKNNCPGVNFPVVSGGFALLGATATATGGPTTLLGPILAGLGLMGVAGMGLMSMMECGGPVRCVSVSGQCCWLLISRAGIECPLSC